MPLYDDKAYLNNGLVFGGRISRQFVQGPIAEERPPLLWWTLATIFATGIPLRAVNSLVPVYGIVLMVAVFALAYEMTEDFRISLYSTVLLGFNSFFLVFSSLLLSDIPGTALGTVFILCTYLGIAKHKIRYIIAAGPILALNLIMRDQNLILIPVSLFFLVLALETKFLKKMLLLLAATAVGVIPLIRYGLIGTLQILSNILTPIIIGAPYGVPMTSVGMSNFVVYLLVLTFFTVYVFVAVQKPGVRSSGLYATGFLISAEFFALMIYPYLWDNVRIGAEFQIAGRGVLSRLISHEIMTLTIGQGMQLSLSQRWLWWITGLPFMVTPTFLVLSGLGLILAYRARVSLNFELLLSWVVLTTGFTIWQGQLEARYLAPCLPAMAILAGWAARWMEIRFRKYFLLVFPLVLLSEDFLMHSLSVYLHWFPFLPVNALRTLTTQPSGWWTSYMTTMHDAGGQLILDPVYAQVVALGIAIPLAIVGFSLSHVVEGERQSFWRKSAITRKLNTLTVPVSLSRLLNGQLTIRPTAAEDQRPRNSAVSNLICFYCGRSILQGSRYCDRCGQSVLQPTTE